MLIHHVVSVEGALFLHRRTIRCDGGGGGGGGGGARLVEGRGPRVIRRRHSRKGCPQRLRLGDFDFLVFSEHHRAAGITRPSHVYVYGCVCVVCACVDWAGVYASNAHPSERPRGCPIARTRRLPP